jgi:hypothetical protein
MEHSVSSTSKVASTEKPDAVDRDKPCGAVLDLGEAAPISPHTIVGLRGQYRPDRPTPIGGHDEVSIEEVEAAIAKGAHVKIVNIPKGQLDELRALAAEDIAAARRGAVQARQDGPVGAENALISDHLDAVKGN